MRALLHETISGEPVTELEISDVKWSTGICRADEVSVTVPGYTGRSLYQWMVPRKFMVTVLEDDGRVRASGMLGIPEGTTDDDGLDHVVFPGRGVESYFDRRFVLPYPYWPLVDAKGYPIASRDTRIEGVEYGTMMKHLYAQALTHQGAILPVVWEDDRRGTRQKEWAAVDGKPVQEAVEDISNLLGGVEWDWVPVLDDSERLTLALVTGTDAEMEVTSAFWHTWQAGGEVPDVRGLSVKVSPEFMTSTAIFTGGKEDDRVLVARATSLDLVVAGLPLTEIWDSSHSSVSQQATLDGWAGKQVEEGQAPVQYWSFEVRADRAHGLRHGDWCTVEIADHWLVPDGSYARRVVEVSGSADSEWLGVTVAGELSW